MRRPTFYLIFSLFLALPAFAEVVQLTDGRTIDLREDGTYDVVETAMQSDVSYVEHMDPYFVHHVGSYDRKRIRFMPIYQNTSENTILGVKFTARFLNVFGEETFKFSGELDEPIASGETSTFNLFYYFEDNQFLSGEPYDKLFPMVTNQSGKIEIEFDMIAFEGGELVNLSN